MASSRISILSLYKCMLREAQKMSGYNFRSYALRRIRDSFREHKLEQSESKISELLSYAEKNLNIIKRQAIISQLFKTEQLVIEKQGTAFQSTSNK